MFLNPTAKPTPRLTPSPRVVFPAPPGSRIASRGSGSGSGGSSAAARRITSRVGSDPVTTWPVASIPPGSSAFRSLSSTGSMSSSRASASIWASAAKQVCTAPKPRMAPHGGLFVYTARPSMRTLSTAYGPTANEQAFEITAVELDAYAPPSIRIRMRTATSCPDARGPMLRPDPRGMPVDVPDERLLAVVDHLHGPLGAQREHRRVDLHRQVLTATERAAHAGQVDAHLLGREVEARRDLVAIDVEPLRRDVDVDPALAVRDRDARLGPEERLILLPDLVEAGDGDVAGELRDRRAGRPSHAQRSAAGRRGSRGPRSAGRGAAAPSRSRAPGRSPARAARTRRERLRPRGAPAPAPRPRRSRRARRSSEPGRSRERADPGTRAHRSSAPARPRA